MDHFNSSRSALDVARAGVLTVFPPRGTSGLSQTFQPLRDEVSDFEHS